MKRSKKQQPSSVGLQMPLWDLKSDWRPPRVADLPSWAGAKRVGWDLETKDPNLTEMGPGSRRGDGFVAGYAFAIEDGPRFYLPLRHLGGDNVEETDGVLRYLRDQAANFEGELVGAHLAYDLDWSETEGIEFKRIKYARDVQVADPLINELEDSYSLAAIAERHGLPGKNEDLLREAARQYNVSPKGGMWQLPARFVGPYAEQDSVLPLQLIRRQERIIDDQELWEVYNLESRLLRVLVRMRQRGVRVDEKRLEKIEDWSLNEERQVLEKVYSLTGYRITVGAVWQAGVLAAALDRIGVEVPRTAKGHPSIKKDLLDSIDHPVAEALAWARKVNKLRTTFAASIRKHLVNGRIHCTFNQLRVTKEGEDENHDEERGAAYGRLSSENPNMQQQPARDEFAKMWRSIYLPDEGKIWFSNDYSQQEPRQLVHYAEITGMPGAYEAAQQYRENPNLDNHDMMTRLVHGDDVVSSWEKVYWKKQRDYCKTIFLGKCYGMGGPKLCRRINLPTRWAAIPSWRDRTTWTYHADYASAAEAVAGVEGAQVREVAGEEGQAIIDKFDERLPFVAALAKKCMETAKARGYIRTLSGRRCRFPKLDNGEYDWTHKALNRLIQGSSADQMKKAMIEIEEAGHDVLLQVHDEVDGNAADRAEAEAVADIMRNTYKLNVPFKVDVETGPSWGEAK